MELSKEEILNYIENTSQPCFIREEDKPIVTIKLFEMIKEYDDGTLDNVRVKNNHDPLSSKLYNESVYKGRCGSVDIVINDTPSKTTYTIGCNFGH